MEDITSNINYGVYNRDDLYSYTPFFVNLNGFVFHFTRYFLDNKSCTNSFVILMGLARGYQIWLTRVRNYVNTM